MKQGDIISFKVLFEEFYPGLVKIALFYVNDVALAEDITQEIFTKLWEKHHTIEHIENIKGYLQYAVKNRCLNHLEHLQVMDKYQQEYLNQASESDESPEEYINIIHQLLDKLPPKRKTILEMSVVDSKSYQEIAVELNISINTVKDHIKKAYSFLRQEMKKEVPSYILYFALIQKSKK